MLTEKRSTPLPEEISGERELDVSIVAVLTATGLKTGPEKSCLPRLPISEVRHGVVDVEVKASTAPGILVCIEVVIHTIAGEAPCRVVCWFSHIT